MNATLNDFADRSAEQARKFLTMDIGGMRELTEQSVEQVREVLDGFLSATSRTMETLDKQAADYRQITTTLAAKTVANSFDFAQKLLHAHTPQEILQLQTEFLESQMQTFIGQANELGRSAAKGAKTVANEAVAAGGQWDRIEGNWKQFKGRVKEKWSKLTESDLSMIEGRRDQLEGAIQQRYGYTRERIRRDIDAWTRSL